MQDLIEKIKSDTFASKTPFINIIQKTHSLCDPESEIYNKDAKPGLFWISNLEEDLFFDEVEFIFLDYQKMLTIITKEASMGGDEERKIVKDVGQSSWNSDLKKFCVVDDDGQVKRVNSFVYMAVFVKIEESFIKCMIKVSPGSMKNFNSFIEKIQQQYSGGDRTATHFKLFKLSKFYNKAVKNPYYSLVFDDNYTKVESDHLKLLVEKQIELLFNDSPNNNYSISDEF